jgi:hypothetical protein
MYPEGFRTLVEVAVLECNVRSVSEWFRQVTLLERDYDAINIQRRATRISGKVASAPVTHGVGRTHERRPAAFQPVPPSGGAGGGKSLKPITPIATSTVECFECKGNHKIFKCPRLTPEQRITKLNEMRRTVGSKSANGGHKPAAHVVSHEITDQDGTFHMGGVSLPFIFNTGATYTFISLYNAMAASLDDETSLSALSRPFPVRTAAQGNNNMLMATHRLERDVNIEFIDGAIKTVPKLRMYVIPGLTNDVILLGKSTTDKRFKLDLAKLLQAAITASDGSKVYDDPIDGMCA